MKRVSQFQTKTTTKVPKMMILMNTKVRMTTKKSRNVAPKTMSSPKLISMKSMKMGLQSLLLSIKSKKTWNKLLKIKVQPYN